ncbi:SWIM zinc finger family protein [Streptomyces sp. NPDC057253]|uniref:SWIM zinc finger family protein n=1 Tax=Streptomyces sp. NPDC057253 TaxID=3346069 RepID=UPI00364573EE
MTPGPADEARRALRAARERATGSAGEEAHGPEPERPDDFVVQGVESSAAEGAHSAAVEEPAGFTAEERARSADEGAAARVSVEGDGSGVSGGQGTAGAVSEDALEDPAPPEHRPGDAARAALREAVAARRHSIPAGADDGTGRADAGAVDAPGPAPAPAPGPASAPAPGSASEEPDRTEEAAAPAPPALDDTPRPSDVRPGDAAREALRAARKRRADAEAAEAEAALARRSRRGTRTPSRDRMPAPRPAAGVRARDVRELLADAFRMPDDVTGPEERHEDNGPSQEGTSSQAAPTPTLDETFPPTPRHAHSMAAPNRDSDLRRTFPAFPPHASDAARFAATWWGNAWVTALEEGALDAKRLARGRGYAEQGHVDAITVTPGLVLAYVQGSRPRPYRVQVRLRTLGDADWDRFLDLAADRTGHIAALLDREMPQSLAECGVPLLPGPGDLEPQCSCPDRGHPCKHAAALCYQTARLLDADPFVLLLLRGRGERELLDALSRLSAARAARAAQEKEPAPLPGVRASEALAPRRLPPLPAPLPVPAHPEQPPAYPASPGGPDPFALDQLATDAAARAHALLGTGHDPVGELTLWQDAVRLAAARPGSGLTAGTRALYASLAAATDRSPADLARAVAAWRQGGLEGLAVLEEPWDPPAGRFDRARPLLLAADLPAFRPWRNHLTHPRGHVQLRLGRDGLWYAYESEPGHDDWWPRGTPDLDPVGALTGLGTPSDL